MKITLDMNKEPANVRVRKYLADQKMVVDAYFDNLLKMCFLEICLQAFGQAAQHLVPNDFKSKYRTTIDLRPVSAGTKAKQWPIPITEAKLSWLHRKYTFLILGLLFKLLAMHSWSGLIWCVWHHCTTRNLRIDTRITWLENCLDIFSIHDLSIIRMHEKRHESFDRWFHDSHKHRRQTSKLSWRILHRLRQTKLVPICKKVRFSYQASQMGRVYHWQWRFPLRYEEHKGSTEHWGSN